jgi:hypothetical protein
VIGSNTLVNNPFFGNGYVAMAMFDYNSSDGFNYAFGPKKSFNELGIDL